MINENVKEFFQNYFNSGDTLSGVIRIIVDVLIVIAIVSLFLFLVRKKINVWKLLIIIASGVTLFVLAVLFKLNISINVIRYVFLAIIVLTVLIYAQEIRQVFEKKDPHAFKYTEEDKEDIISIICDTVTELSKAHTGALISIEKTMPIVEAKYGKKVDAIISKELLLTIFFKGTPLHDGAVVIRNNRILCAGAYYKLTDNHNIPSELGTRHRAAIGVSENYDAYTIVVSEETGSIRVAQDGIIKDPMTVNQLREGLGNFLAR